MLRLIFRACNLLRYGDKEENRGGKNPGPQSGSENRGWLAGVIRVQSVDALGDEALLPANDGWSTGLPPAFEVASVKPSSPLTRTLVIYTFSGGRITGENRTLQNLIEEAFNVQAFQISGGAKWVREDRYDFEAKPPASSKASKLNPPYPKAPPNEEQRQMLQALLTDRFRLKYRRETKEGPVYVLVKGTIRSSFKTPRIRTISPGLATAMVAA